MGIGITGYLQASEEQRSWLKETYEELRRYDQDYSHTAGFPTSIKLTTVKPSGTLSLLPGVTPGCHPAYARYLIRRIRVASNHSLVDICRNAGYKIEYQKNYDGTEDRGTVVIEFPFSYPEGTVLAKDMSAIAQLEVVRRLQTEWSDNAVSCTVYYKMEELEDIKAYLKKHFAKNFKSLSFLLHSEHGFAQAPYEEITEEEYNKLVSTTRMITEIEDTIEFDSDDECATGVCPIK
jgi:ribonucleoside-triphosphate reductase